MFPEQIATGDTRDLLGQKAAFVDAWREAEAKEASKRQGARTDIKETFPECSFGQTRDLLGQKVGASG